MNENIVREKTVCFTGHRTEKLPQGDGLVLLRKRLANEIERALQDGYDTFLFGGAYGFDLMAAEEVLKKKTLIELQNPRQIRLIAVIPFEEQAARFSVADHELYYEIMPKCDEVITLNTHYHNQCYAQRNQYMVDHSNRVICCWNRQSVSGTAQTVRMAERQNLEIINLL
ncbi:MAG: SLOG family protein [Oscillospiraceae bacterium]|uniref:SLOG family protein n=1 Tax=Pygmaiobacter massiliensis TaxID=1917873 RepID=UPI0028A281F1|nr:SLOG family protein [Pygmaiobacter massiliensis]MDD3230731.1 SLOG family protein [Oscillospiraceae bacterium]